MYRIWYWATIDRESDGRFVANIPDLGDLAAYGTSDKDAVAHVTDLAREQVRTAVEAGSRRRRGATSARCRATCMPRSSAAPSSRWKSSARRQGQRRPII